MANNEKIDQIIDEKALVQFEKLQSQLRETTKLFADNITAANTFNEAVGKSGGMKEFTRASENAANAIKKVQNETQKAEKILAKQALEQEKAFLSNERALDKAAKKSAEASRAYNVLSKSLDEARKRAKDLGVTFGTTSPQFRAAQKEVIALDTQIKKIDSSLGQNQRNVGNYSSALTGLGNNIKGLVLGYISFQAAINSLGTTFTTSVKLDAVKTSLGFIFRSTGDVNERLRMLSDTAERLGLEFLPLANSYKSFAGAAVASNFPLKEADRLFQSVANASAKLKLSSEQTEGALNALQQMISKGNVQAEELRGQLGERIPGAFSIAARAMGVTEQQLNKLLKDGDVLASDLLPKLATELDKTFDNNLDEKVDSLQSSVNRLKNVFTDAVNEGNTATFFKSIVDGAFFVADTLAKVVTSTGWNEFFARLGSNKEADVIRGINIAFRDAKREIDALNKSGEATQAQYNAITIALTNARKQYEVYNKAVESGELKQGGNQTLNDYVSLIKTLEFQQSRLANILPKVTEEQKKNTEVTKKTKEELAKELRALLDRNKAKRDALLSDLEFQKLVSEGSAKVGKRLSDDENLNTDDRIANLERYIQEKQNVLDIEKQKADIKADFEVKALRIEGKLTSEEQNKINNERKVAKEKFRQESLELDVIANAEALKIFTDQLSLEDKARLEANKKALNDISILRDEELRALEESYEPGIDSKEQYEKEKLKITRFYVNQEILEQIRQTEAIIALQKSRGENVSDEEAQLAALRLKYSKEATDAQIEDLKRVEDAEKKLKELQKELAGELFNLTEGLFNAGFERRLQGIDKEIERNEEKADFDREQVEDSIATEEEKEIRLAQIDANAQGKREQLEARQRQIQVQQARFQKASDAARIISQTSLAIISALAQVPKFDFGISAGAIAATYGAIGSAQLAAVLATPIPAFKHGKDKGNNYEGIAWVGDGMQSELVINPDGSAWVTPAVPTLTHVSKDTEILSGPELKKIMAFQSLSGHTGGSQLDSNGIIQAVKDQTGKTINAIKNSAGKGTTLTSRGLRSTHNTTNGFNEYISRNF